MPMPTYLDGGKRGRPSLRWCGPLVISNPRFSSRATNAIASYCGEFPFVEVHYQRARHVCAAGPGFKELAFEQPMHKVIAGENLWVRPASYVLVWRIACEPEW